MPMLIERDGRVFELPDRHTIEFYEGSVRYVALNAPGAGGSLFTLQDLEEREDAVVVHLGVELGCADPASFGDVMREATSYPFPESP
jgi:hypothetical protein